MIKSRPNPFDDLYRGLSHLLPDVELQTRKADDPDGFQFLNLFVDDFEVSVEWKHDLGFGISSGYGSVPFEAPDEWYTDERAALHRIASLVFDRRSTQSGAASLSEIRRERGITQESLSEQLGVRQAAYSKLERRRDVKISSLRQVVEAMGGRLVIQAVFADAAGTREITFDH